MYDHSSLFEEADTEIKTIADAIKIAFGIDIAFGINYKLVKAKEDGNGSNGVGAVGVNNNGGPSGERGGGNDAKRGELLPEGDGKADGGRRDQGELSRQIRLWINMNMRKNVVFVKIFGMRCT